MIKHWMEIVRNHDNGYLPGGGLPYEEYTGVCHELGSFFKKKFRKGYVNFSQKFRKGL